VTAKHEAQDLPIHLIPGPVFAPDEIDSLAELVATMIYEKIKSRSEKSNQQQSMNHDSSTEQ
jgi:hypothetical protein